MIPQHNRDQVRAFAYNAKKKMNENALSNYIDKFDALKSCPEN